MERPTSSVVTLNLVGQDDLGIAILGHIADFVAYGVQLHHRHRHDDGDQNDQQAKAGQQLLLDGQLVQHRALPRTDIVPIVQRCACQSGGPC
ncbi:hypothetical protein [Chromobacterium haemolyticum]|uniref:hypothetical protein n=1 Tax=Chromobacterium haemolyticum TaxID=394935 RepID=UPI0020CAD615|nr:hypothetical protein [Chromobacterium haemolyticum]